MAEPENQTLHILRDLRETMRALDLKVERGFNAVDAKFDEMRSRMDNIRQALNGESVLGRYAAAEVEDLDAIEKRLEELEKT